MSEEIPTAVEEFRPVPGYEGRYSVSNLGRVKSHVQNKGQETVDGILKGKIEKKGYRTFCFRNRTSKKHFSGHRLVLLAFVPYDPQRPFVNHKNGVKTDNRLENLEWCTASENTIHRFKVLGHRAVRGSKNNLSKLTEPEVMCIRLMIAFGFKPKHVAQSFETTEATVSRIRNRLTWDHV